MRDNFLNEAMRPVSDRARWYPERCLLRDTMLARPGDACSHGEKARIDRMADLVAVVEMVGAGIVEIYRLFDKAQTNDVRIEISTPGGGEGPQPDSPEAQAPRQDQGLPDQSKIPPRAPKT